MPVPKITDLPRPPRQLLRDVVTDRLRQAILDGTFAPGERLHDDELQKWLDVSRTPIRDALHDLEREGLIESSPNRYTRVSLPHTDEAPEVIQTIGVLMGGVVRIATPALSQAQKDSILTALDVAISAVEKRSRDELSPVLQKVWEQFIDYCGNKPLVKVCRATMTGLAYKLYAGRNELTLNWEDTLSGLQRLRAAIVSSDAVEAELATELIHLLPSDRM